MTKNDAARNLIDWHFKVEPDLRAVYRIVADNEDAEEEPIKLLEVNDATFPTGSVEPFGFGPTPEIPFRTVIAEVTSEEFEVLRGQPDALPEGWSLATASVFERPKAA